MNDSNSIEFLNELEGIIRERSAKPIEGSYTTELLQSGVRRIAQKVGEEAVELALAATSGDRKEQLDETADLLYHVLVLLASKQLCLADAVRVLELRHTDSRG
ncbi:MAG: phosphoribosyl-ATP diphosphatase [Woeseia sp.]|jgi:phosphoribosyl-ATP pyrophosphohydrolase/phosphoribosyl-AMP cyclohydrolase